MNYTNDQLTQLIAKMLPETVVWTGYILCDNGGSEDEMSYGRQILDTELLHLCSLVEAGLTDAQWFPYSDAIIMSVIGPIRMVSQLTKAKIHATWQQRCRALAACKGVDL